MTERQRKYLSDHQEKLDLLQKMWRDPRVQLYNDDKLPNSFELRQVHSLFLAGPTSRNQILEYNWRCEAVALLRTYGFHGWIYCPEPRGLELAEDFTERSYIHTWESDRLMKATHVAFWVPRKADELLGLNTNLELGVYIGKKLARQLNHQKLFIGWPHNAERMGLPRHYTEMSETSIHHELLDLCKAIAETPRSVTIPKL